MKKITFFLAILLIGGLMIAGCKKPTPEPEPEPTPATINVTYMVANTDSILTLAPCFKLNVTYFDAKGQEVTENGVTLPWTKSVEVTKPFRAMMRGELVYNEEELPDTVVFGRYYGIGTYDGSSLSIQMIGGLSTGPKEKFLNYIALHPEKLQFSVMKDF